MRQFLFWWCGMNAVVLVAASLARPADSLGGVAAGAVIVRSEMESCSTDSCSKAAAVAGVEGKLTVFLCGERVRNLVFSVGVSDVFSPNGYPTGLQYAANPAVEAKRVHDALSAGLAAAGWTPGQSLDDEIQGAQRPGVVAAQRMDFHKGPLARVLTWSQSWLEVPGYSGRYVWDVRLFTVFVGAPCTVGL